MRTLDQNWHSQESLYTVGSVEILRNPDGVFPKPLSFDLESANRFNARSRGCYLISGSSFGLPADAKGKAGIGNIKGH